MTKQIKIVLSLLLLSLMAGCMIVVDRSKRSPQLEIQAEEITMKSESHRDDTKQCPKCKKKMIKCSTGECLTVYPPIYPQIWWCGCGHTEPAPAERGKTMEQLRRDVWEAENQ